MEPVIDCFFVGHNEMQFEQYESMVRSMGKNSGAYRDLNLNFIRYQNRLYPITDLINLFCYGTGSSENPVEPVSLGNTFSLAIAYLGTYLTKRGFTVDYVNSFRNDRDQLAKKLQNTKITAIAIPTTLYVSVFPILEIIAFVKKYNNTAKIILGGPFMATQVRTQDQEALQYTFKEINADFYVNSSQGELTLSHLLRALRENRPPNDIPNLYYRDGDKYRATPILAEDNRLEDNIVDWGLFGDRLGRLALVRTSLSCPFSCAFCGFPRHAGKYRTTDLNAVEQELNSLDRLGKVASLTFTDDTLNIPIDRFKDLLRMMIRNKYQFKWNCNFRCQLTDREMIELMKESGCEGVFLGFESGSQLILNNMKKSATVEKYQKGLALLREYDILTYGSFIIGFPGETSETVKETVAFIEENRPTFFRTQLWYCDPFTPIWEEREKYRIKNSQFEWSHATMDAATACDLIDEIFLTVKNSIWVPQYNFEFFSIFNLLHRGMSLEQVKNILNGFTAGIKEKLTNPLQPESSPEVFERLKAACLGIGSLGHEPTPDGEEAEIMKNYQFDFNW